METVNSKSGFSSFLPLGDDVVTVVPADAYGFVGETTSSCHVFLGVVGPCFGLMGPVGVMIVDDAGIGDCGRFWKT